MFEESKSMAEETLTDTQKEARFEEQWAFVMAGLDRAVAWLKENKPHLRRGFSVYMNPRTGAEISLGYVPEDDEVTLAAVREIFRGATATRSVDAEGHEKFVVRHAGLTFCWEVYHWRDVRTTTTTEVLL
jgi:hypothetical protein